MEIFTESAKETKKLAYKIAKTLKGGEVLALSGNLGSGKTTFVQGLAEGLCIKERVLSPSYVLMRKHYVKGSITGIKNLYHIDLYRLSGAEEAEAIGLTELFGKKENVVVIEWAERANDIFGKDALHIDFQYGKGNERKITLDERIKI
jgi:tRNA threonylcarbamoyladenosine biosynthesis protein TsaE